MRVIHILKDGSVAQDISDRVVKVNDAIPLYQLISNINKKRPRGEVKEVRV
jgi:hypothetical protein